MVYLEKKEVIYRMEQRIVIYHPDFLYSKQLAGYLKEALENTYQVNYFTDLEVLQEYLRRDKMKVFIVSDSAILPEDIIRDVQYIIYLTKDKQRECRVQTEHFSNQIVYFYEYQSMENLVSLFWHSPDLIHKMNDSTLKEDQKTSIISILTPEGYPYVHKVINEIVEENKEAGMVMCLSFQPFGSITEEDYRGFETNYRRGLSDYFYCLREHKWSMNEFIEKSIMKSKLYDFILPVNHFQDLFDVKKEEIEELLSILSKKGYKTIIVVITMFTPTLIQLLVDSKIILAVSLEDIHEVWRNKSRHQIKTMMSDQFDRKFGEVYCNGGKDLSLKVRSELKRLE